MITSLVTSALCTMGQLTTYFKGTLMKNTPRTAPAARRHLEKKPGRHLGKTCKKSSVLFSQATSNKTWEKHTSLPDRVIQALKCITTGSFCPCHQHLVPIADRKLQTYLSNNYYAQRIINKYTGLENVVSILLQ